MSAPSHTTRASIWLATVTSSLAKKEPTRSVVRSTVADVTGATATAIAGGAVSVAVVGWSAQLVAISASAPSAGTTNAGATSARIGARRDASTASVARAVTVVFQPR